MTNKRTLTEEQTLELKEDYFVKLLPMKQIFEKYGINFYWLKSWLKDNDLQERDNYFCRSAGLRKYNGSEAQKAATQAAKAQGKYKGHTHTSPIKGKKLPKEWKDKIKTGVQRRYVDHPELKQQISETCKESWKNMSDDKKEQHKQHTIQMWNNFTQEQRDDLHKKKIEYWTQEKRQEKSQFFKDLYDSLSDEEKKKWSNNAPGYTSKWETEVIEYIKTFYNKDIIHSFRDWGFEIDIYCPEEKIGIELNGVYWHSQQCSYPKPKNYHREKQLKCLEHGVRLIHIWEFEYIKNKEKVLQFIKSCFNIRKRGYVDYKIAEINKEDANKFLEDHHLYGGADSSVYLGLFTKDGLVAVSTFNKIKKGYEWKRYCQLPVIIQGKSIPVLMFECFRDNYMKDGETLVDYQQLDRWGDDKNYSGKKMGFKKIRESESNIWISKDGKKVTHRTFSPEKKDSYYGKKLHPEEDWSSDDVAKNLGYFFHIYGAGTITWEYTK